MKQIQSKIRNKLRSWGFYFDLGGPVPEQFVAGMGRSGTTWVSDLINYDNRYRVLFEPFFTPNVPEACDFPYIPYISPDTENPILEKAARKLLSGSVKNQWIERDNHKIFYLKRMVKEVRANLMLGWIKRLFPTMHIILVVRHPLAVLSSWQKRGWGNMPGTKTSDLDLILGQSALLTDFPIIGQMKKKVDIGDYFQRLLFEWCIMYYVPFQQVESNQIHTIFYENLILNFEYEIHNLYGLLGVDPQKALKCIDPAKASSTNFWERDFSSGKEFALTEWKATFSSAQINKTAEMLTAFGLDALYDQDGKPMLASPLLCK